MAEVIIDGYKVSEKNCNLLLTSLYKERDNIGRRIDRNIWQGLSTEKLEEEYDKVRETINKLCDFRRHHECLLEGDAGCQMI